MDNQNPMTNGGMPQNATPPQDQTNYNQAPMSSNVVVQPGTPDIPPENAQDPNIVNVREIKQSSKKSSNKKRR